MLKRLILAVIIVMAAGMLAAAVNPPVDIELVYNGSSVGIRWVTATVQSDDTITQYYVYRSTYSDMTEYTWNMAENGLRVTVTADSGSEYNSYIDTDPNTHLANYYMVQAEDVNTVISPLSGAQKAFPYAPAPVSGTPYNSKAFISWNLSENPHVTSYNVYRSLTHSASATLLATVTGGNYLDEALINGLEYVYSVYSVSGTAGSMSVTVTVKPFARPFMPINVQYSADASNMVVSVSWTGTGSRGSYDLAGYNIYRSTYPELDGLAPVHTEPIDAENNTAPGFVYNYIDTVPNTGTRYHYHIEAADINGNTSYPFYFSVYVEGIPGQVKNLAVDSYNSKQVSLSWDKNDSQESVSEFIVFRDGGELGRAGGEAYTDSSVDAGETHSYYVYSSVAAGTGPASEAVTVTALPDEINGISVSPGSSMQNSVDMQWNTAWSSESVSMYNVYRETSPIITTPAAPAFVISTTQQSGVFTFTDITVTPGTNYFYSVAAVVTNSASNTVTGRVDSYYSVTPSGVPGIPSNLTGTAYNGYNYIMWDMPPASDNVTGYNLYRVYDSTSVTINTAQNYYYDLTVTSGGLYEYSVEAFGFYGLSSKTAAAYITATSTDLISTPRDVSATSLGDGSIYMGWSQNSGDNVTGYYVFITTTAGLGPFDAGVASVNAQSSYLSVTWLPCAITHYFKVVAYNSTTYSAISGEDSAVPFILPSPPQNVQVNKIFNDIILTWETPAQGHTYGTSGTRYNIYRSTYSGAKDLIKSLFTGDYFVDTDIVTANSVYYYRIKTVDDNMNEDTSSVSYQVAMENPVNPPGTVVAIPGSKRVTLVWSKVTPDFYNIYRSTVASGLYGEPIAYNIASNSKEYLDTGLQNNTIYYYQIASVNESGEGQRSNVVAAMPYEAVIVPDSSLNYVLKNKKDIELSWTPAADSSSVSVSGYSVYRSADGGAYYDLLGFVLQSGTPSYYDNTSEWDNTYFYLVKTVDEFGHEDKSYDIVKVELPLPTNKLRVYRNLVNLSEGDRLKLRYQIVKGGEIKITIHSLSGVFVKNIYKETIEGNISGVNPYESPDIFWDGTNENGKRVAAGVYLIVMQLPGEKVVEKVAVVK